jgi:threonine/homoserine/homoserine lactone efflux protein
MPGDTLLLGFVAAALVVLLIPGPGVLYMVARSLGQGQRAGLVSVVGLSVGALVHVSAATAGLSAILLTSATAFGFVKTLGAGYLIYLGVRAILARDETTDVGAPSPRSLRRLFIDGVVVSVLNPKIAVFFLAFLPQFVDPSQGPVSS